MIKCRRIRQDRAGSTYGREEKHKQGFVGKPEGKKSLGRHTRHK
jgi:hypothetical protein